MQHKRQIALALGLAVITLIFLLDLLAVLLAKVI